MGIGNEGMQGDGRPLQEQEGGAEKAKARPVIDLLGNETFTGISY